MKKIITLSSLLVLASTISCKEEFLNVQPLGVLSESNLTNKIGVELVLTGAYSLMDGVQTNVGSAFADWQGAADNWVYGSVASDDAYKGSNAGDQPEISVIEAYNHTAYIELQRYAGWLRLAQEASNTGIFEHDHETDVIYWSPVYRAMHGRSADEPITITLPRRSCVVTVRPFRSVKATSAWPLRMLRSASPPPAPGT